MKQQIIKYSSIVCGLLFIACNIAAQPILIFGKTQGTTYSITYFDEQRDFSDSIDRMLKDFSTVFSSYDSLSLVSRINRNEHVVLCPDFIRCFNLSQHIAAETDGAFDITAAPIITAWGFGPGKKTTINPKTIDSLLHFVGYRKLALSQGQVVKEDPRISLLFNAIAQGYSVDMLSRFLLGKGIRSFFVEIGGEVFAQGKKQDKRPWIVGIENPEDNATAMPNGILARLVIDGKAVSTSGNYRNFYYENGKKYAHTIDPTTGYPVKNTMLSATIRTKDCASADAYATACMAMGIERAKRFLAAHKELDAYLTYIGNKGKMEVFCSKGLRKLMIK